MADMARPLRIGKAGGWYHVTARGNERKSIFRDNRDRQHFLEIIAEMVSRFRVCLGGAEFLAGLRRHVIDEGQEQRGARRLVAERPAFATVIAAVEQVKGRKWAEFRDEYSDTGSGYGAVFGAAIVRDETGGTGRGGGSAKLRRGGDECQAIRTAIGTRPRGESSNETGS
jgi:hypothetical protein